MKTIASILLALWSLVVVAQAGSDVWQQQVTHINAKLDESLAAAARGDKTAGKTLAEEAYFGLFENQVNNMEVSVRVNISGKRAYALESQFTELRQGISQDVRLADLLAKKAQLIADLNTTARELDAQMPAVVPATTAATTAAPSTINTADTFGKSLLIILREGFEIILLLGAITAFLIKAGAREKLRVVTSGFVCGIVASVATAVASMMFVNSLKVNPEIIEGATLLLAAVVLFFVSHWLISNAESKHWMHYLKEKVDTSISTGNMTALWLTSFLAVYREGAETVLFYQGLSMQAPGQGHIILTGFALGCLALLVLFLTFRKGILRIPPRPFFRVTSALLYYMAFVFAGKAVIELQAGQVLHLKSLQGWPTIDFLGIYPTVQSLALQGLFVAAIVVSMLIVFLRRQTPPPMVQA